MKNWRWRRRLPYLFYCSRTYPATYGSSIWFSKCNITSGVRRMMSTITITTTTTCRRLNTSLSVNCWSQQKMTSRACWRHSSELCADPECLDRDLLLPALLLATNNRPKWNTNNPSLIPSYFPSFSPFPLLYFSPFPFFPFSFPFSFLFPLSSIPFFLSLSLPFSFPLSLSLKFTSPFLFLFSFF